MAEIKTERGDAAAGDPSGGNASGARSALANGLTVAPPLGFTPPGGNNIVRVPLSGESGSSPSLLTCTPALALVLQRAAFANETIVHDTFDLSFTSLLFALVTSPDPTGAWLAYYARESGVRLGAIVADGADLQAKISALRAHAIAPHELATPRSETRSVIRLLQSALDMWSAVHGWPGAPVPTADAVLNVRHVVAAFIYDPADHTSQLADINLERGPWSNAFLEHLQLIAPEETSGYEAVHRRVFPSVPVMPPAARGPSTHIATDRWTIDDTLGYRAYAYAIARFMRHPDTKPPLTISIQAPWGGGKTSLMRMIQHELDPQEVPRDADSARPSSPLADAIGPMTVAGALGEVHQFIASAGNEPLPAVPHSPHRKMLTIWFNAWKYESANQIWAGLVDSIMQQVAARLSPIERERFWLRLNLRRVDADKVRQQLYDRVFRAMWRTASRWLAGGGVLALLGALMALATRGTSIASVIAGVSTLATLGAFGGAIVKARAAKKKAEAEPAAPSLSAFLDVPDYSAELGFIHKVERDLSRVLASVPADYWPIVIFVDDLDRCSPQKIAQVVEGVNSFLAGDIPDCMFVMGMDTELVAAALQAAHKEMIAGLPADAGIPVGWRFMDKFVQLPFLIPPMEAAGLSRYTSSLFVQRRPADGSAPPNGSVTPSATEATEVTAADTSDADRYRAVVDLGVARFSDENEEIRRVVAVATAQFRGNPRDVKRFVNAFRFEYFLWWARKAQQLSAPSLEQLVRWTVLSMKWPEVVRWLRRGNPGEWSSVSFDDAVTSRLRMIEEVAHADNFDGWLSDAARLLRVDPATAWLRDEELRSFFYDEKERGKGNRLSDGIGKGLW